MLNSFSVFEGEDSACVDKLIAALGSQARAWLWEELAEIKAKAELAEQQSKRLKTAVKSWKLRLCKDPSLADVAMEDLLPLAIMYVLLVAPETKRRDTESLAVEVVHKLMTDEC